MADVTSLNVVNFPQFVAEKDRVKVVRFRAIWCRPCVMLEPTYDEVAEELADIAGFGETRHPKWPVCWAFAASPLCC